MNTASARAPEPDDGGLERLFSELYRDLRRLAHARLKQHGACTLLDTTALVHESYLRFQKAGRVQFADRAHFVTYAARVMRSVVVDFARESLAQCRGGGEAHIALETDAAASLANGETEILRVHEALDELAAISERLVRVVEMRYFSGMSDAEIGEVLNLTERTVRRDWEKARLILSVALRG